MAREAEYSISRILEAIKLPVTRCSRAYVQKTSPQSLRLMEDRQPNGAVACRFWQRGGGFDQNLIDVGDLCHHRLHPCKSGSAATRRTSRRLGVVECSVLRWRR
jgi:hypothetical protein